MAAVAAAVAGARAGEDAGDSVALQFAPRTAPRTILPGPADGQRLDAETLPHREAGGLDGRSGARQWEPRQVRSRVRRVPVSQLDEVRTRRIVSSGRCGSGGWSVSWKAAR